MVVMCVCRAARAYRNHIRNRGKMRPMCPIRQGDVSHYVELSRCSLSGLYELDHWNRLLASAPLCTFGLVLGTPRFSPDDILDRYDGNVVAFS